ncbi:MAG: hypothetical protein KGI04_01935 [Candidatus Micrarchaeota archaeon]|nr:hypothetical protein [Candidatus Micrarchaeota archaeon]
MVGVKYKKEFASHFAIEPVFTSGDARRFLANMGASGAYARLFVHKLVKAGELLRISKGKYTFKKDEAVVGFAFRPFYYGLEYALTIRRIWTQMANPVIVTTTKAVPGPRKELGRMVQVRRISEKVFFGIEYLKYGDIFVPVSDVEKTLLDFIYYRISPGEEVFDKLLASSDAEKLRRYQRKFGGRVASRLDAIRDAYSAGPA